MTIVQCHFEIAGNPLSGSVLISPFSVSYGDGASSPSYETSRSLVSGSASISLVPGQYYFTAIDSAGRVVYSQRATVPLSLTPVNLIDIAAVFPVVTSELDQTLNELSRLLINDAKFVALVGANQKPTLLKSFTDADLTIAGLLVWTHNAGSIPGSIRVIDGTGEDWNVPYDDLSVNALSLDFSAIRPIPGSWQVLINPS